MATIRLEEQELNIIRNALSRSIKELDQYMIDSEDPDEVLVLEHIRAIKLAAKLASIQQPIRDTKKGFEFIYGNY